MAVTAANAIIPVDSQYAHGSRSRLAMSTPAPGTMMLSIRPVRMPATALTKHAAAMANAAIGPRSSITAQFNLRPGPGPSRPDCPAMSRFVSRLYVPRVSLSDRDVGDAAGALVGVVLDLLLDHRLELLLDRLTLLRRHGGEVLFLDAQTLQHGGAHAFGRRHLGELAELVAGSLFGFGHLTQAAGRRGGRRAGVEAGRPHDREQGRSRAEAGDGHGDPHHCAARDVASSVRGTRNGEISNVAKGLDDWR